MRIPPKKPHFFKPILPGFKDGLKIPIGFLKYLKGHEHIEHAVLKRAGKKWLVKVNCRRFEEGWKKFAEEHDLQLGDLLIFRHEGDMEFEVSIFDSSHLDREYADYLQKEEEEAPAAHAVEETSKDFEFKENATEKPKPNVVSSHKDFPDVEAAKDMPLGCPHFIYTIKPSFISKYLLPVPILFARENGLSDRKCTVTIRDEQRSWVFRLYTTASTTFIGGGWRKFCAANFLKEGDRVMFEMFSKGEEPILKFYDLRANASLLPEEKKPNLDAKRVSTQGLRIETSDMPAPKAQVPAPTSANTTPHFISTIKPYVISRSFLCLPIAFARSNGLIDRREMILRDEKQRSWSVQLRQSGQHFAISKGLQQFMKANGVQVGDTYKFELINNETIPVAYFHCKYPGKNAKPDRSP